MNLIIFLAGHAIESVFRTVAYIRESIRQSETSPYTYEQRDQLREDINDGR